MQWARQIVVSSACSALESAAIVKNSFNGLYSIQQLRVLLTIKRGFTFLCNRLHRPLHTHLQLYTRVAAMKHPIRAQIFVQMICLLSVAQLFC
ncbi:hypothetical protein CXQ82_18625 [Pseudomonas sp. S09G 359]|nr:hypothetical protein CXQ82_18625 [Pseudomonas sp. S09G 359]